MWISYPIAPSIDIFQSRDLLENVEGKTSIELLHKRLNFHLFLSRKYFDHLSIFDPSFLHLQSILSTGGNISIINSATKRCKTP